MIWWLYIWGMALALALWNPNQSSTWMGCIVLWFSVVAWPVSVPLWLVYAFATGVGADE